MQKARARLQSGDCVHARGQTWQIVESQRFDRLTLVSLRGIERDNAGQLARLIAPFDVVRPLAPPSSMAGAPRARVLRAAADLIAGSPPWLECATAGRASIDLRTWQLEPARSAIRGATRILIADDVGLGKTIQAGLLLSELVARGLVRRALILTPASLRVQWQRELQDKFATAAAVLDHAALASLARELPPGVNPWVVSPITVSSIDLVKRPEVRRGLEHVPLDLLVIDEAHHVTPGTDRAAVVMELATRALWVVLLTATPHSGDETAYQFLLGIGAHSPAEPVEIFRRSRSEIRGGIPRRLRFHDIHGSEAERALLAATLDYTRRLWRQSRSGSAIRLVASVIARRAASSAAAARITIARRLALLEGAATEAQPHFPWDEDDADSPVDDAVLSAPGLPDAGDERARLRRLENLASAAEKHPTKVAWLLRLLRRTREAVLVFTEFRDVASAVAASLKAVTSVATLHGGMTARKRQEAIAAFTAGRTRVLVTTDAAGEGVNLHARCRLVVNIELPWNPLRIEQRIGRVDRLGQTRRVHAIALLHRESYEEVVRSRVVARAARAAGAVHGVAAGIAADGLARDVFEGATTACRSIAPAPRREGLDRAEEPFARVERRLRRLTEGPAVRSADLQPLCAMEPPPPEECGGVVLLFSSTVADRGGRWLQREIVAVSVVLEHLHTLDRPALEMARLLASDRRIVSIVEAEVARRCADLQNRLDAIAGRLETRLGGTLRHLESMPAPPLQPSLFDRRAEQQSRISGEARRALLDSIRRRMADLELLRLPQAGPPRVVAAWPAR